MKLKGTILERINAAVEFGRAHRTPKYDEKSVVELYNGWAGLVANLNCLNGCMELSDDEIFNLLYQALNRKVPQYRIETFMPGSIESVVE